jgi:hypothetical protein
VTFQTGDHVLYDGKPCCVRYTNSDVVVIRRISDGHLMMWTPAELADEQVPWVLRPGMGWWSQMRDVAMTADKRAGE